MGFLLDAWYASQKPFTMTLKQVVFNAGDGMLDNDDSISELRAFLKLIDLNTMERLIKEACEKDKKYKFDTRGFAFQDIINEMGRRLGYDVQNGLYKGKRNEIGFDGLWKAKDGSYIVMESKTSDDYGISMESVTGYRDKLIIDHRIPKKKCSILIVYGRDERKALTNTAKGSSDAPNIRLISANALFQLVKIYTLASADAEVVLNQINNMLRPRDFIVLDNLVELVFPQTDPVIDAVEETDDEIDGVGDAGGDGDDGNGTGEGGDTGTDGGRDSTSGNNTGGINIVRGRKSSYAQIKVVDDGVPSGKITLHTSGKKVTATGYAQDSGFVVLKGSTMRDVAEESCRKNLAKIRKELLSSDMIEDFEFIKSVYFPSPSMAASIIFGGSRNGKVVWIDENGTPLKDL